MLEYESKAEKQGFRFIAGVDEAGRGPLAGPVVAAAVILANDLDLEGLNDSKQLSPESRDKWYSSITEKAVSWGIGTVSVEMIDGINILQASRLAMKQAVENLAVTPDLLLIDGNQSIDTPVNQWTIVQGDRKSYSIAAASVLAKVTRDRIMQEYHEEYPQYEFHRHKGYGTQSHQEKIRQFGPCPIHRKTFKGVREYLSGPPGNRTCQE